MGWEVVRGLCAQYMQQASVYLKKKPLGVLPKSPIEKVLVKLQEGKGLVS